MKNPLTVVTQNKIVKEATKFYFDHQSLILTGGTIGFSIATTAVTMKNSRAILNTLDDAKAMLAEENDDVRRKDIYAATLKELAPKIIPIVILQAATIVCSIESKKLTDANAKKLSEATAALTLAQGAITQYQAFNEKAEEELGEKKTSKIRKEIAKERIEENPKTEMNTFANGSYLYHDVFANRYIYSDKSPADIEQFCFDLSKDLYDGNCDDDETCVNDIYAFLDKSLQITSGNSFGWRAEDGRGRCASDLIRVAITPAEMNDHQTLCYDLDLMASPLFRTRL
jgi:hypothetical protein